jgi:hypothetical protein
MHRQHEASYDALDTAQTHRPRAGEPTVSHLQRRGYVVEPHDWPPSAHVSLKPVLRGSNSLENRVFDAVVLAV